MLSGKAPADLPQLADPRERVVRRPVQGVQKMLLMFDAYSPSGHAVQTRTWTPSAYRPASQYWQLGVGGGGGGDGVGGVDGVAVVAVGVAVGLRGVRWSWFWWWWCRHGHAPELVCRGLLPRVASATAGPIFR